MKSIKDIYKIGKGPSSSHTMGPAKAMKLFAKENPDAEAFEVVLYGSLSDTGKGHGTDVAIAGVAGKPVNIVFDKKNRVLPHENTMDIYVVREGKRDKKSLMRVMSVGGGDIEIEDREVSTLDDIYEETTFAAIAEVCTREGKRLSDYVYEREGEEIFAFLDKVWCTMQSSVDDGLAASGILPGGLEVQRKAKELYASVEDTGNPALKRTKIVSAYAYAVGEQNADNGTIVTAPTCGACAVLPAVLTYLHRDLGCPVEKIYRGLAVAGLVGNLTKTNASISGAECGCQAEIGTACAMAAAALSEIWEEDLDKIEYAAEMAFEHFLGLTCDPISGLVQIPCIERNAVAAMRAINAAELSGLLTGSRKISLDMVIKTMYETGKDLSHLYRETSAGGLAKLYHTRGGV